MSISKTRESASNTELRKIREVARELAAKGYQVEAEIRGRKAPVPLGAERLTPDLVATKNGHRIVVEVKTPSSLKRHSAQVQALASWAEAAPNTTLRLVVTKPRKASQSPSS